MGLTNTVIEDEIQTIESIFPDDLQKEVSDAKAWKGASMAPSFNLRVSSDDPELSGHVYLTLHVQYSKTYPIAAASFSIKPPIQGVRTDDLHTLTLAMNKKAGELAHDKQEMVFDIRQLCVEFLASHNTYQKPSTIKPEAKQRSLAVEMKARAESTERAMKALADKEADTQRRLEQERAARLEMEMQMDEQRREKTLQAERESRQAKERFLSREHDDTLHRFGTSFPLANMGNCRAVKVLVSEEGPFGDIAIAEPLLDAAVNTKSPLNVQLLSIVFTSAYYGRSQGKKRLKETEAEIQALTSLEHSHLVKVHAVELKSNLDGNPILDIVTERPPTLTLKQVLEQSEVLRPDRAIDYGCQIVSALAALSACQLPNNQERGRFCHRCVCLCCINLRPDLEMKFGTRVILNRPWYYNRLMDQHRSNPFHARSLPHEEVGTPRLWTSREVEELPHMYNQKRDTWDTGVVLLQMLLGLDAPSRFPTVHDAVDALQGVPSLNGLQKLLSDVFDESKKLSLGFPDVLRRLRTALHEPIKSSEDGSNAVVSPGPSSPISPVLIPRKRPADYFSGAISGLIPPPQTSRYREEWEEMEFLGKGGFGSVVKARFKLDGAIYAVKKVKLRGENDGKIYREINALSRLNHRFIVRYHTTWIENSTSSSGFESPTESSQSHSMIDDAGVQPYSAPSRRKFRPVFREELSIGAAFSESAHGSASFPSIHFGHSDDSLSEDETDPEENEVVQRSIHRRQPQITEVQDGAESSSDSEDSDEETDGATPSHSRLPSRSVSRRPRVRSLSPSIRSPQMLYIQMEYVERQTLKEAIEDGIGEKECWRLFRQILEGLAHIASLGIVHRDVKLTNIFIGANGDVKLGDFGLATSSLAGIDPSDVAQSALRPKLEMTYGVGTALYTAPEVLSKTRAHSNHAKVDMYSLGIVFFEMCWPPFQTTAERIEVLTKLRLPSITFPDNWVGKDRERLIISRLLRHNPAERPTALELSNSSLLPEQEEDAYFEEARRKIQNSDEQCEVFISELFKKRFDDVKQLSYDIGATPPEHSSLNDVVQTHLEQLFHLHGAVHKEPLLLTPLTEVMEEEPSPVKLLDSSGRAVFLPRDHIVGFARLAIPTKDTRTAVRVKRFHIGNVYVPSPTGKQPVPKPVAIVDIIHTDLIAGAAEAELIRIASEGLNIFPGANNQQWDTCISHTEFGDHVFSKVPEKAQRKDVALILSQGKPWSQKRAHLLKLGIPRGALDEIDILAEDVDDVVALKDRLERVGATSTRLMSAIDDVKRTIDLARILGVTRPLVFRPFIMLDQPYFRDGVVFEIRGVKKSAEPVVKGGRYDHLIAKYAGTTLKNTRAIGMQLALEPIVITLAENLAGTVPRLIKEQRSFGFWSPSRCDVYVVSFQKGLLTERLETASLLWQNGIRADVMYESAVENTSDPMAYVNMCAVEGILFMVWYRPKTARRDHAVYKVKSVLKKTEHEVNIQDLVPWLNEKIAEQRRADATTPGSRVTNAGSGILSTTAVAPTTRETPSSSVADVQVIVSGDSYSSKYQKHKSRVHHAEKAYVFETELRSVCASGLPIFAVETSAKALEALTRTTSWLTSEVAFKSILTEFQKELQPSVANQLRDAIIKKAGESNLHSKMIGLIALRDERLFVIRLDKM